MSTEGIRDAIRYAASRVATTAGHPEASIGHERMRLKLVIFAGAILDQARAERDLAIVKYDAQTRTPPVDLSPLVGQVKPDIGAIEEYVANASTGDLVVIAEALRDRINRLSYGLSHRIAAVLADALKVDVSRILSQGKRAGS